MAVNTTAISNLNSFHSTFAGLLRILLLGGEKSLPGQEQMVF